LLFAYFSSSSAVGPPTPVLRPLDTASLAGAEAVALAGVLTGALADAEDSLTTSTAGFFVTVVSSTGA
jgi:hypothetical protein